MTRDVEQCMASDHFAFTGCAYGTKKGLFDVVREDSDVIDVGRWRFCITDMVGFIRM